MGMLERGFGDRMSFLSSTNSMSKPSTYISWLLHSNTFACLSPHRAVQLPSSPSIDRDHPLRMLAFSASLRRSWNPWWRSILSWLFSVTWMSIWRISGTEPASRWTEYWTLSLWFSTWIRRPTLLVVYWKSSSHARTVRLAVYVLIHPPFQTTVWSRATSHVHAQQVQFHIQTCPGMEKIGSWQVL